MSPIFKKIAVFIQDWTLRWSIPLVFFSTILILFGTLTPSDKLWKGTIWSYDKIGHAGLFFGWTWNYLALLKSKFKKADTLLNGLIGCFIFGALIEILQFALPINRGPEILDLGFDLIGGFIAALLFMQINGSRIEIQR